jgi:RHS repeat-associated protein
MYRQCHGMMVLRDENDQRAVYQSKLYQHNLNTGIATRHYAFGGKLVALREGTNNVNFLLTDHLGSVTTTLFADGTVRANLRYDPWGKQRWASSTTPTRYRFTAQRFDDRLGLYDYNARYYDANIGRFISADVIVPGTSRLTPLTVGFHETMFLEQANGENVQLMQLGPVFRWGARQKQELGTADGPATPQNLNRFAYGLNNPQRYVDPSGHSTWEINLNEEDAQAFVNYILGAEGEFGLADILYAIGEGLLHIAAYAAFLTGGLGLLGLIPFAIAAGAAAFLSAVIGQILKFTAETLRTVARQVDDELASGTKSIRIRVESHWWGDRITVHGKNRNSAVMSPQLINQAGPGIKTWALSGRHNSEVTQSVWGATWRIWRADGTLAFP